MKQRVPTSWIFAIGLFCSLASFAQAEDLVVRLNKIFYWQMSTELNLSPKTEKEMIAIMDDIQSKRHAALEERELVMQALASFQKEKSKEGELQKLLDRLKSL